jgi:hypothetical protein
VVPSLETRKSSNIEPSKEKEKVKNRFWSGPIIRGRYQRKECGN